MPYHAVVGWAWSTRCRCLCSLLSSYGCTNSEVSLHRYWTFSKLSRREFLGLFILWTRGPLHMLLWCSPPALFYSYWALTRLTPQPPPPSRPHSGSIFLQPWMQCCGFGSRRAKMTHKNRKKLLKFHFLKCSKLGRPLWRPRDKEIVIFVQKKIYNFSAVFISMFGHQNPGSGSEIRIHLKCWIRIRFQ